MSSGDVESPASADDPRLTTAASSGTTLAEQVENQVENQQQVQEQQEKDQQQQQQQQQAEDDRQLSSFSAGDEAPFHGLVSYIGRRKDMEDAASAIPRFFSLPCQRHPNEEETPDQQLGHFHFFGVYDGHGGPQAANFCKDRFHNALIDQLRLFISSSSSSASSASSASSGSSSFSLSTSHAIDWEAIWERAMRSCFFRLNAEIEGLCVQAEGRCDRCGGSGGQCTEPVAPESVGSTAVVAVVGCCRIIVANCGDSRIIMCRGGRLIPLSDDHKPERPDEMARIEAAGGRVIFWNGYRVMGMLAMSRAIGDRYLRDYVIPDPDIRLIERTPEDEFLVLASDGLWDVVSNREVCDITRACLAGRCNSNVVDGGLAGQVHGTVNAQARIAAAYLTKLAWSRRSSDNISVLVVDFRNRLASASSSAAGSSIPPQQAPAASAVSANGVTTQSIGSEAS